MYTQVKYDDLAAFCVLRVKVMFISREVRGLMSTIHYTFLSLLQALENSVK